MHTNNVIAMPKIKNSVLNKNSNSELFKRPFKKPLEPNQANESVYSIIKRYKKLKDTSIYLPKLQLLQMKPPPNKQFCVWFKQLIDCVPIINKEAEAFISDVMSIPWQYGDEKVVSLFQSFILSLVTSHNYFLFHILESLFKQLLPVIKEEDNDSLKIHPFQLSEEQKNAHQNIIHLVVEISQHVPMCENNMVKIIRNISPYFKNHVHVHSIYTFNMLQLCELLPSFRKQLFEIIISNMIKLDLYTPKFELDEDVSDDEMEESGNVFHLEMESNGKVCDKSQLRYTAHETGHTLDILMCLMFRYIHFIVHGGTKTTSIFCLLQSEDEFVINSCKAGTSYKPSGTVDSNFTNGCQCNRLKHDNMAAKLLYLELKDIFYQIILPTYSCSHVQFILFYLLSIRPILLTDLLDLLRNTFENCSASRETRRNALAYLGSLLSRGNFIAFTHVHSTLELLRTWCTSYLDRYGNGIEDIQKHTCFYYACQTILYVFTFNYKKYTENKIYLKQAESLHLNELVLSSLNPLRYCLPAVAENFSTVARRYQIAYCHTILENNRRVMLPVAVEDNGGLFTSIPNTLDMFFPFDPYLLKRSEQFVKIFYKEFEGIPDDENESSDHEKHKDENDDDEYDEEENAQSFSMSTQSLKFSFEMSPGFKK